VLGLGALFPALAQGAAGGLLKALQIPLGLAFVLYIPGYLLQALFFPKKEDLDGIERAGLSLGLSVAIIMLLVLLLNALPWGLRPWPIILAQGGLVLLLAAGVALVRWRLPIGEAYSPALRPRPRRWWAGLSSGERVAMGGMGGALLLALLIAAWVFLFPSPGEFMTEFYMLGKGGLAEDYPRAAAVGETLAVTMGITNRERGAQTYYVEGWVQDGWDETRRQQVGLYGPYELAVGETVEVPLSWSMPWAGEDQRVEFLLFMIGEEGVYRELRLWVDVEE
jgi:uncharacterized membrane protein